MHTSRATLGCRDGAAGEEKWRLRVSITGAAAGPGGVKILVPVAPSVTIADLHAEVAKRLANKLGNDQPAAAPVTIASMADDDGFEPDPYDLVARVLEKDCKVTAVAVQLPGPEDMQMQSLRQVVHGSTASLTQSQVALMRQTMALLSDGQLACTYGLRLTAARLTPEVEARGGVDYLQHFENTQHMSDAELEASRAEHAKSLDKRTAVYNDGIEVSTAAGAKWLNAVRDCNLEEMKKMLGGDFGGAAVHGVPLFEAVGSQLSCKTKWLLNYQAPGNTTAVLVAIMGMDPQRVPDGNKRTKALGVLQFLAIEMGAAVDVNRDGAGTALHYVALRGLPVQAVRILVKAGAEVDNNEEEDKCTPLHFAAQEAHAEIVECLLVAGADPNRVQKAGGTALMMAAQKGDLRAVSALIDAGAAVNAQERAQGGASALTFAAHKGHAAVVLRLLEAGAQVNMTCAGGHFALHNAMLARSVKATLDTVRILLRAGADMDVQNNGGFTAMVQAERLSGVPGSGHRGPGIMHLLQQAEVDRRMLERGAPVQVQGLVAAAELKGRSGMVLSWNATKQRYIVQLEVLNPGDADPAEPSVSGGIRDPQPMAIRPANLCMETKEGSERELSS
eukprot:SAG22_NODE_17_length_32684_cov_34.234095_2_plen_618_part_00